jgi:hypothetical protein
MVMQEQSRRLAEPLRWGKREKTIIATVLSVVALALIGLVAYGLTSGSPARKDCIDVTFASTLGGAELKGCGSQARRICASGHTFKTIQTELKASCERAGFPFAVKTS